MSGGRFDVVIQGGGMVGLVLARALAPLGLKLALVDAKPVQRWRPDDWDLRVSAVTVASERILRRLGVWEELARVSPFRAIQAWDAVGRGSVLFDSAEISEPHLGHIIENSLIQTVLYDRLLDDAEPTMLVPAAVEAVQADGERAVVSLDDGRRLEARLLVGADGAGSRVRTLCGIEVDRRDYGQSGLVATIRTERRHGEVARQRFLPGGPLAFLPLADGRCSIVWSQPSEQAQRRLQLDEQAFLAELTVASGGMLGRVEACGRRAAFPLRRQHARSYVAPRAALIGDAAHVIHPLAGQGANLGFLDAAVLAEEIERACRAERDIGGIGVLRRYQRRRKGDNLLMQSAMDGFHQLFGSASPWLAVPRSLGFNVVDGAPPLKAFFMRRAMGLGADLPSLAR
jgi:2-octaprenylphenol hydroxylase